VKRLLKSRKKNIMKKFMVIFITGSILGFVLGVFIAQKKLQILKFNKIQLSNQNLNFTSPLLGFELGNKNQFDEFRQTDKAADKIIAQAKNQGAKEIGFYFRDLTTGHWTGINETRLFTPGSLQKIPLMIAYFKIAQTDLSILSKQIADLYPTDANAMQTIKPKYPIEKNQNYPAEEMIRRMVVYSDNNATAALTDSIDIQAVTKIFTDLNLKFNPDQTLTDYISPKDYGLFLRMLYNSTYLNSEMSDRALGIMAQSDFKEGLAAKLPLETPIAHKHGELHNILPDQAEPELTQLHDCGIIYYPNHPYMLCVMTKGGADLTPLKTAIQNISQLFYDLMQKTYP